MATTATQQSPQDRADRSIRRRPFSTWMKRLTNFKGGSSASDASQQTNLKRNTYQMKPGVKKQSFSKNNNPYPESGHLNGNVETDRHRSFSTVPTGGSGSISSIDRVRRSTRTSEDGQAPPTIGNKSTAATVSTDVAHSEAARSHAASSGGGTMATTGYGIGAGRGVDSTFSSPAPSVRSLTTTLTTIHSAAAPAAPTTTNNHSSSTGPSHTQIIHFSHQFPTSPPPTALPAHLAPQNTSSGGHPATYSTATANNLLTDNASILTLASSSKRRRRRSMDTDASVRALAPSSLFGNSRESLPLSVLSSNIESNAAGTMATNGPHAARASITGLNERASIYSATGVAPALPSERNSYYAGKQALNADAGSVKSGFLGHGRNNSISGSIGAIGTSGSPLATPREATGPPSALLSGSHAVWGEAEGSGREQDKYKEERDVDGQENEKKKKL